MRKILILPAIHNETVGVEVEFVHKTLSRGIQVGQESGVGWVEIGKGIHLPLRDNEHVKLIAWRRMMKRNQARGFTEAGDWDEKTHVGKNPADKTRNKSKPKKFPQCVTREI